MQAGSGVSAGVRVRGRVRVRVRARQSSSSEGMQVGCRQKPATGMACASPHMSATPVSVKALMIRSTLGAAAACSEVGVWRLQRGVSDRG